MTISNIRLAKAWDTFEENFRVPLSTRIQKVLEADDAFRASEPKECVNARASDDEPELPSGVTCDSKAHPTYNHDYKSHLYICHWSPAELRVIADHMEWKSRSAEREAAVPAFTEEMARDVWTEWSLPKPDGHHTFTELARLMNEKLDAQRKAGGK